MKTYVRFLSICAAMGLIAVACQPELPPAPEPQPQSPAVEYAPISDAVAPRLVLNGTDTVLARQAVGTTALEYPVNNELVMKIRLSPTRPLKSVTIIERYSESRTILSPGVAVPLERAVVTLTNLPARDTVIEYSFVSNGLLGPNQPINTARIVVNATTEDNATTFKAYDLRFLRVTSWAANTQGLYANDTVSSRNPDFRPGSSRGSFFDSFLGTVSPRQAAVPATTDITYTLLNDNGVAVPTFLSPDERRDTAAINEFTQYTGAIQPYLSGRTTLFRELAPGEVNPTPTPGDLYSLNITSANSSTRQTIAVGKQYAFLNANNEKGIVTVRNIINSPYPGFWVSFSVRVLRYQGN